MADFAVSLTDPTTQKDAVALIDCESIVFTDHSNYNTSTETGHLQADFSDYFKLILEHHNGYTYTYSAMGDGDASIDPPAIQTTFPIAVTWDLFQNDGLYTLKLIAVPTWRSNAAYQTGDCVYHVATNKLWKAVANNTNIIPGSDPVYWVEVTEDTLPGKYRVLAYGLVLCNANECLCGLRRDAVCTIEAAECNDDLLCKEPCLLAAYKAESMIWGAEDSFQRLKFQDVGRQINLIKKICECECGNCKQKTGGCTSC